VRPHSTSVARFIGVLPPQRPARWAIIASWDRCSHLSASIPAPFHRVGEDELQRRLERRAGLVAAAQPRLERLLRQLPGTSNVACVTDEDAVVLASCGDASHLQRFCLMPGYDWSERRMGTNGAGTCLVAARPMVVAGAEHLISALQGCTCTAAPIRGRDGSIVGALDVSSAVADAREQRMAQVTEVALEIEGLLRGA
jgi:transcriptional regulator of acetoin/glycerol metabolism